MVSTRGGKVKNRSAHSVCRWFHSWKTRTVFPAGDTQVSRTSAVLGGAAESCGDGGSNDERGNNERSDLETEAIEEKEDIQ